MKKILITILFVLAGVGLAYADLENLGEYDNAQFTLSAGYYWVETEDNSARAKEYSYQDVSGTAAFNITHYIEEKNFS